MPIEYGARERSYELFRKGKRAGTWDPDDFDVKGDRADWAEFADAERKAFLMTASGFYDGEEDVTRTLAPYMVVLDRLDGETLSFDPVQEEMFLAQQLYEEAKHTDFFSRYYEEVFGMQDTTPYREGGYQEHGYSTDDLYDTADDLLEAAASGDQRTMRHALGGAYFEYMGIVEAQLARSGYMSFDQMASIKAADMDRETVLPGFQAAVGKIRQDESRHIENGRWVLRELAATDPEIVPEVYEPRIRAYVEDRIVNAPAQEMPFEGYDGARIGRTVRRHLQDTIDYIGAERFSEFEDVDRALDGLAPASD